ncbi:unnamed protein product [Ostreobium quekettii]|uniref:Uncharacterized protein n=1 Tax=Ostreobium quekettii TaxID=121088 RepID=A0A8S1J988_9CHLO|nr:unnamed protein product [Ostreobium quekettii]
MKDGKKWCLLAGVTMAGVSSLWVNELFGTVACAHILEAVWAVRGCTNAAKTWLLLVCCPSTWKSIELDPCQPSHRVSCRTMDHRVLWLPGFELELWIARARNGGPISRQLFDCHCGAGRCVHLRGREGHSEELCWLSVFVGRMGRTCARGR